MRLFLVPDLSRWDSLPPICNWIGHVAGRNAEGDPMIGVWVARGARGLA